MPPHVLNESLSSLTSDGIGALRAVMRKLCHGEPLLAAAMGSSITFGHGLRDGQRSAWPALVEIALRAIWAAPNVSVQNVAVPATAAPFAALCFESLATGCSMMNRFGIKLVGFSLYVSRRTRTITIPVWFTAISGACSLPVCSPPAAVSHRVVARAMRFERSYWSFEHGIEY